MINHTSYPDVVCNPVNAHADEQFLIQSEFIASNFNLVVPPDLNIPTSRPNFTQLIIVPPVYELGLNQLVNVCRKNFSVVNGTPWKNLDRAIKKIRRDYKSWRAVWSRDCQEADNGLVGLDRDRICELHICAMDIYERLLLELFMFQVNKRGHLDQKRATRCDSVIMNGQIPIVSSTGCRRGGVRIGLFDPRQHSVVGVRQVHF